MGFFGVILGSVDIGEGRDELWILGCSNDLIVEFDSAGGVVEEAFDFGEVFEGEGVGGAAFEGGEVEGAGLGEVAGVEEEEAALDVEPGEGEGVGVVEVAFGLSEVEVGGFGVAHVGVEEGGGDVGVEGGGGDGGIFDAGDEVWGDGEGGVEEEVIGEGLECLKVFIFWFIRRDF